MASTDGGHNVRSNLFWDIHDATVGDNVSADEKAALRAASGKQVCISSKRYVPFCCFALDAALRIWEGEAAETKRAETAMDSDDRSAKLLVKIGSGEAAVVDDGEADASNYLFAVLEGVADLTNHWQLPVTFGGTVDVNGTRMRTLRHEDALAFSLEFFKHAQKKAIAVGENREDSEVTVVG